MKEQGVFLLIGAGGGGEVRKLWEESREGDGHGGLAKVNMSFTHNITD